MKLLCCVTRTSSLYRLGIKKARYAGFFYAFENWHELTTHWHKMIR